MRLAENNVTAPLDSTNNLTKPFAVTGKLDRVNKHFDMKGGVVMEDTLAFNNKLASSLKKFDDNYSAIGNINNQLVILRNGFFT